MEGGQKERLGEVRAAEDTKRTSQWPSRRGLVMMVPREEQKDEAVVRQYAMKASVPSYSELTARHRLLCLLWPSSASHQKQRPREVQGAGDADDGVAGVAQERCARRLGGPIILPPATLVIVVAILLVTLAQRGAFAIGRALGTAP